MWAWRRTLVFYSKKRVTIFTCLLLPGFRDILYHTKKNCIQIWMSSGPLSRFKTTPPSEKLHQNDFLADLCFSRTSDEHLPKNTIAANMSTLTCAILKMSSGRTCRDFEASERQLHVLVLAFGNLNSKDSQQQNMSDEYRSHGLHNPHLAE